MHERPGNSTFVFALALSLALHVAMVLIAPNPAGAPPPRPQRKPIAVRLVSQLPSATQPEQEVQLGLDAPAPPTKVWLGFTDYLKQLAARGEFEQAAFTDTPLAAAPPPTPPVAAPDMPAAAVPERAAASQTPIEPTTHDTTAHADAEPTPANDSETDSLDAALPDAVSGHEAQQPVDPTGEIPAGTAEDVDASPPLTQPSHTTPRDTADEEPGEPSHASSLTAFVDAITDLAETARESPQRAAAAQASPPSESRPVIARHSSDGAENAGARSDRESDATSIIDVPREQWQLGKPLAAQGLEIKPRRPTLTILTSLTAWPRNPLCRISFDRSGVPKVAKILQSTGDSRVDAAIEASLYRWRASGERLQSLQDSATVDLTIRLVINPERGGDDTAE